MSIMNLLFLRAGLIAALLPVFAAAQPAAEGGAANGDGIDPNAAFADETPEQRLDRLFEELAKAEGPESDKIANQITAIWGKSGSDSMDLLFNRARKASSEDKFDRARAHLSALNRLAPEFAEGWNASATLHFRQENYWRAIEDIQRALALEPRHFGALSGLALILEHVGRKKAALEAWREVARLFPGMEKGAEAVERLTEEVEGDGA